MGGTHKLVFGLCILFCVVISMILSLLATAPMLEYDESEIYSCPKALDTAPTLTADGKFASFNSEQDKAVMRPAFGYDREEPFYDPLACKPFYQDTSEPVWYSRVENVVPQNQHLVIYGFIHGEDAEKKESTNKEITLKYSLHVRAKNNDEEEWHYYNPAYNTVEVYCKKGYDICTYFPVGFVPFI